MGEILFPFVRWAQDSRNIYLKVELQNVQVKKDRFFFLFLLFLYFIVIRNLPSLKKDVKIFRFLLIINFIMNYYELL